MTKHTKRQFLSLKVILCVGALLGALNGAEYYVAPDGKPNGLGTREKPCGLVSALEGARPVRPGDTLWLRGGKYRSQQAYERGTGGFSVKLVGTKEKPVHIRACPGERVTLDGGMQVVAPATHVWLWDLEITVAPEKEVSRETKTAGSHPGDLGAPGGGLNVRAGRGCKFINLVIQDNFHGGMGWWIGSQESEVYGCIIVNNGWKGPDRCHGHCIYTQNRNGTKTISNCIMTTRWGGGQYTMHAYGSSRAYVDNFVLEENICYDKGPFLVGGGRPSRHILVRRNLLYKVPMRIGYSAPYNEDCLIQDNVIVGAGLTVKRYRKALVTGNLLAGGRMDFTQSENVTQSNNRLLRETPLDRILVVLRPNIYDPRRANLAVCSAEKAKQASVDVSSFLKPNERFRLMNPEDFYGDPVLEGTCRGATITVPLPRRFAVYVLLKG